MAFSCCITASQLHKAKKMSLVAANLEILIRANQGIGGKRAKHKNLFYFSAAKFAHLFLCFLVLLPALSV